MFPQFDSVAHPAHVIGLALPFRNTLGGRLFTTHFVYVTLQEKN
jgi:hypothetical protein